MILPPASPEEQTHSERLSALLRREIAQHGPMPFARFMEIALYAPGLGYYTAGMQKFGASGDFTTAPESYPLFGRCLAVTIARVLEQTGGEILEVGAGSGRLAATLLNALAAHGALPSKYYILELSAELRTRQAATLRAEAPSEFARVNWLERLPTRFDGVVLGNELLDAMPVERFRVTAAGAQEVCVTVQGERFAWSTLPAPERLRQRVEPLELPPSYTSEVGFAAEAWVRTIAEMLTAGVLLLIDYGFPRTEFYHPERSSGTLMCHYRHRAHADPLVLVGLQDITAHVDFTAMAQAGTEADLDLLGYTSQAAFLIGNGLEQLASGSDPNDARAHLAFTEQIKKLTLPHEMGELYKVIALGRGLRHTLSAFALQDRRSRL